MSIRYSDIQKMTSKQKDEWAQRILNYDKEVTEYTQQISKRTMQVADRLHNTKMDIEDLVEDVQNKKADQNYRMNEIYAAKGMSLEAKHHAQKFDLPVIKDTEYERAHDGMSKAHVEKGICKDCNHPEHIAARERAKKKLESENKDLKSVQKPEDSRPEIGALQKKTVLLDYKKLDDKDPKSKAQNLGMGMTN